MHISGSCRNPRWQSGPRNETPMPSTTYALFRNAILGEQQVVCLYDGRVRELCPHIIGTNRRGEEVVLAWQFGGESSGPLPQWRCLKLANVSNARARDGRWHEGGSHRRRRPASAISISTSTSTFASCGTRGDRANKNAQAASAGLTRFAISAPFSRSTTPMSYCPCRSSQNCALLPK